MAMFAPAPAPKTKLGHYRVLSPNAGIHVSPIQLGAANIGDKWASKGWGAMDKESSFKLLDAYVENGGNFIDTANGYQDETSEAFIGGVDGDEGHPRPARRRDQGALRLFVADYEPTQLQYSSNFKRGQSGFLNQASYSGNNLKSMTISVEASLKKLRTSYIDLFYVHYWDWDTGVEEVMNGLHNLVVQGKVLYLGISDAPAWVVAQANQYAKDHGKTPFAVYQGRWNVMERAFEREILPMARAHGLALAPWDVLAAGKFRTDAEEQARRDSGEKGRTAFDPNWERNENEIKVSHALEKVAGEVGAKSIQAVAIAYVMHKAPYVFPIIGGRKIEHLLANVEALDIALSPEQIAFLEGTLPFDVGFPGVFIGDGTSQQFLSISAGIFVPQPRLQPIHSSSHPSNPPTHDSLLKTIQAFKICTERRGADPAGFKLPFKSAPVVVELAPKNQQAAFQKQTDLGLDFEIAERGYGYLQSGEFLVVTSDPRPSSSSRPSDQQPSKLRVKPALITVVVVVEPSDQQSTRGEPTLTPSSSSSSRQGTNQQLSKTVEADLHAFEFRRLGRKRDGWDRSAHLGAANIGDKWASMGWGAMDKESSFKLLDAYVENGGNFIDTANGYQDETSEAFIGEWMETRGIRDQLVIATKYSSNFKRGQSGFLNQASYSGNNLKSMTISVEASLKKLRTSYIDLFYVHYWDWDASVEEVMNGLHNLVVQGKVLYLGISDAPAWVVAQANQYAKDHGKTPFAVYQGRWNVMERAFEREILPMARAHGLALAPWDVLAAGKFRTDAEEQARRESGEKGRTAFDPNWERNENEIKVSHALEKVAGEAGAKSIQAVAIAYVMHKAPYVFPIIGGRKIEHLLANVEALDIALSPEQIAFLEGTLPFDVGFPGVFIGDGTSQQFLSISAGIFVPQPRLQPIRPTRD
ncbi:Aldo-ket-red domain-containing protein [Mycena chlorophos]|uniref:Aldo-ket-red domain-containing protein n=1 Tax=Mycena chlorophos TaxID=658473 RepID=A0A8H6S2Q5_MYCCL|nr:Aldo-ket-red domain-containing protein [Mycena chlorophos]